MACDSVTTTSPSRKVGIPPTGFSARYSAGRGRDSAMVRRSYGRPISANSTRTFRAFEESGLSYRTSRDTGGTIVTG